MPLGALALVRASEDLHRRVARLDKAQTAPDRAASPVQSMHERLAMAF
ncbi:DUF1465 family protein [Sphingomonas bacterium]|nr:DUF1465 family protein [Sphingomonas bacterium]